MKVWRSFQIHEVDREPVEVLRNGLGVCVMSVSGRQQWLLDHVTMENGHKIVCAENLLHMESWV